MDSQKKTRKIRRLIATDVSIPVSPFGTGISNLVLEGAECRNENEKSSFI